MLTVNLVHPADQDGSGETETMMTVWAVHAIKKIVGEGQYRRSIVEKVQLDFPPNAELPSTFVETGYVYVMNDAGTTIQRYFLEKD